MKRSVVAILGSAAARVALGVLFSSAVALAMSPADASRMFQLLYLQGGLIAFLSASAYARATSVAHDERQLRRAVVGFVRFALLSTVIAILAAPLLLPTLNGLSTHTRFLIAGLMIGGATATALNGFLQGAATVRDGRFAAFWPSLVVSFLGCLAVLPLLQTTSLIAFVSVWAFVQILTPLVLLLRSESTRRLLRGLGVGSIDRRSLFAMTGAVNAISVGAVYSFRERWSGAHSAQVASTSFYVSRLSDLLMQVVYMALASSPGMLRSVVASRLARRRGLVTLGLWGVGLSGLGWLSGQFDVQATSSRFALAEAAVFPARCIASLCLILLLGRVSTRSYIAAIVASTGACLLMLPVSWFQDQLFGLQSLQAIMALVIVVVTVVTFWISPLSQAEHGAGPSGP